ncbi:tetratricopeptide repeat protein [Candidatus Beckwithbacteria bacterium]|nr:tetratricopeptide repeat protein [Candidatus Beckwithbacteria bacterium]
MNTQILSKFLSSLALIIVALYVFLMPLFFLPVMSSSIFDFPKWMLTMGVAIILILLVMVKTITEGKLIFPAKKYSLPLLALLIITILSMVFAQKSPQLNLWENFLIQLMGKGGLILALTLIVFNALILIEDKVKIIISALVVSSTINALVAILAYTQILPKLINWSTLASKGFNLWGGSLSLLTALVVTFSLSLTLALKEKVSLHKMLLFVAAALQGLALILSASLILPGQAASPKILPWNAGWSIAIDQLKNVKTALIGTGPNNFANIFNQFRVASLNTGDNWFIKYTSSSNEWFTILTTLGLLGLLVFVFLSFRFVQITLQNKKESNIAATLQIVFIIMLISMTVLSFNVSTLFLFFTLLILIGLDQKEANWSITNNQIAGFVYGAVLLVIFVGSSYLLTRASLAEIYFGQSLLYASQNKVAETYNAQIKAIQTNQYVYKYHVTYSNTNLALANSLASKKDLTDNDKKQITQLVSQAIREAKGAVALDYYNTNAWVNLASVYRQLINFAGQADQWAITSYINAVKLDKTNPQLRIDLGGLLYSLKYYEDALDQFKQAINLKPDFANAYYNLAYVYMQLKQYTQAYAAMQNVVSLVDVNSADHEKALNELAEIQKNLPTQTQQATSSATKRESELVPPQPTPEPKTQVDLKGQEDLEPPTQSQLKEIIEEDQKASQSAETKE